MPQCKCQSMSDAITNGQTYYTPPSSSSSEQAFSTSGINEVLPSLVTSAAPGTQQKCSIVTTEINPTVPNIAPAVCAPGHHLNKDGNGCLLCPPGTYTGWINRSQDKKYNDGRNYYNGNKQCELCPPGTYYNKKGLTCPKVITDGTYEVDSAAAAAGFSTSLLPCIALTSKSMELEHTPSAGSTEPKLCSTTTGAYTFPLRWVSQDTGSSHLSVSAGQNAASSSSSSAYLTAKSFISIARTTGFADPCITCPLGFRFKRDLRTPTHLPCDVCPPGKEKRDSEAVCSDCKKCTFRSGDALQRSIDANGNSYANPWPDYCMTCPTGKYSAAGSKQCWSCPPGKSTPTGLCDGTWKSCRYACPAGNRVVKNMVQDASTVNGTIVLYSCTQCLPGTHSSENNADTFCTPCKGNRHAPTSGARLCTICGAGKTANDAHTECTGCDLGHYLDGSSLEKNNTCRPCDRGTYAALKESTRCTTCAKGSYTGLMGQAKCTTADAGSYVNTTRATSVKMCPPGTFQPYNNDPNRYPTTCTKCAPGKFQTRGVGNVACNKALLNEFTPDIPGTEPTSNMSTSSLTLIDGTHGTSRFPVSCPKGSWTGPQSTNEIYVLYGKVYKLSMEARLGVHGIDGNRGTGNGEWTSRRRNFDPAAGFPKRKWSINVRRRACSSCPVHWYNPMPSGNCRDCEPRKISVFGIGVTDERYSNWMRTSCHNCWTEIVLPHDSFGLRWITLPWPYHYISPDDNNDAAQCVIDTKVIIIVILIITSPCLLCMLCALTWFLPKLVMMVVRAIRGSALLGKKLAKSSISKVWKVLWKTIVTSVKLVMQYTWYAFVMVVTVSFLIFISLNSGLIWIMDKLAYLVSQQIAAWEDAYLLKHRKFMPNAVSSQPHPTAIKLMKKWGFAGVSRTTITARSARDTSDHNRILGFYILRLFLNVLLQIIFITVLCMSILFIVVPQMSTSAGWARTSSTWNTIAWCVLGCEVVVCIVLTVAQNRFWDEYDDQSALQMTRAKQMILLTMVWWALLVVLSGANVFGDKLVENLRDVAVIPIIS